MREENTATSKSASEEVVCSEQAGGVHGVAEGNVDEDALHDYKDCGAIDCDTDGRDNPVDGGAGGPGEEEEADGWTKCCWESRNEAALLGAEAVLDETGVGVVVEVANIDTDTNHAGDEHAEEDKTDLSEVHAVVNGVHQREHLEEGVVDTVDDGSVDLNEEDSRILECDLEGLDERLNEDSRDLHVPLVDLALGHEALATGELAQTAGALEQDGVAAGLGEEHEHDDEDRGGGPDGDVEGPAPAFNWDGEAGEERAESSCSKC